MIFLWDTDEVCVFPIPTMAARWASWTTWWVRVGRTGAKIRWWIVRTRWGTWGGRVLGVVKNVGVSWIFKGKSIDFSSCFKVNLSMVSWNLPRKDVRWSWAFEHFSWWQGREMRSWNHKGWHGHALQVSPTMPPAFRFFHIWHVKNRFSILCQSFWDLQEFGETTCWTLHASNSRPSTQPEHWSAARTSTGGVLEGFPFREG